MVTHWTLTKLVKISTSVKQEITFVQKLPVNAATLKEGRSNSVLLNEPMTPVKK